jgi:drug/metabolite transporter (DMT)-like permease
MFIGEASCLVVFFAPRLYRQLVLKTPPPPIGVNPWLFALPAACDFLGTSLMYVGLLLTYASNFQMLRGSAVLFIGLVSRIFLKRMLQRFHILGMALVMAGTAIVGLDAVIEPDTSASARNPMLGNTLIVLAQVVVAVQFCVEEVFVSGKNVPPLLAVGLEGVFGGTLCGVMLLAMYYLPGVSGLSLTRDHFDDAVDAFQQIGNNGVLLAALMANLLSIACFNFFGISVTKVLSAAHRIVLDSVRTCTVWIFSLAVYYSNPGGEKGQQFHPLQAVGFAVLLTGTLVYYELLPLPARCGGRERTEPLLKPLAAQDAC